MNNLYDVLEICLQELENGADLESVLARYPDLAEELRPILKASIMARTRIVSDPAPDVVRRGRAKLLQHASQMREAKVAPRKRMIPFFQRLAISFTLATVFLASGTGLVGASSSALPGENLYPVKRTWEDLRLFFTFDSDRKGFLESEYENERLDEVGRLLTEGRHETIQFAGVFSQANGVMYISGVTVLIPANLQTPVDGATVVVTGRTNTQGFVEIDSIELLPAGTIVPAGRAVEVDTDSTSGSKAISFEVHGTVESISNNTLVINGQTVYLGQAKINGVLQTGVSVEVKGSYDDNGSFVASELKAEDSESDSDSDNDSDENESSDGNE